MLFCVSKPFAVFIAFAYSALMSKRRIDLSQHQANWMPHAQTIATEIANMTEREYPNTEPRAYLVGGAVRDLVLELPSKDADIEVYGISQHVLESLLYRLFGQGVNLIGKSFCVYHVRIDDDTSIDIALPRTDTATGLGHRDFEIAYDPAMPIKEAARRRDFTINAMLVDLMTGELEDPFDGLRDLEERTLRVVDAETFIEDPLRAYRALQFVARFGLALDTETERLLRNMVSQGALEQLPAERITEEVRKLILSPKPSMGFDVAKGIGIIARAYPELAALERTAQDPQWHPEGNVWIHTMMAVDEAAELLRDSDHADLTEKEKLHVMLGILCHDLGKPETSEEADGRIHAHGHEQAGVAPTKRLLARWRFHQRDERAVCAIVAEHLKPVMLSTDYQHGRLNEEQFVNALRRLLKRVHPASWKSLLTVSEADRRGRGKNSQADQSDAMRRTISDIIIRERLDETAMRTLITGQDLLKLGMQPGPAIGALLQDIENARDDGKISTPEEALAFAKESMVRSTS